MKSYGLVCAAVLWVVFSTSGCSAKSKPKPQPSPSPQPLHSGYIPVDRKPGSALYYAYWESANSTAGAADEPSTVDVPILLWLQGGPGCASTFGAFYELGPFVINDKGKLEPNPYAWNNNFGLLVIDQPVGAGYSIAASEWDIPQDMTGVATDLYEGLWKFFDAHPELQQRPLFITGESYAGKYIPSIAHYILQAESNSQGPRPHRYSQYCRRSRAVWAQQHPQHSSSSSGKQSVRKLDPGNSASSHQHAAAWQRLLWWSAAAVQQQPARALQQAGRSCWSPKHPRQVDLESVPAPNFRLTAVAIGNGLTDPNPQTRALAGVVYNMGLVSDAVQSEISQRTVEVVQLMSQGAWAEATRKRTELLEFIQQESGVATLLDVRRAESYDAAKTVDVLLNSSKVRQWMGASNKVVSYSSCSADVDRAMSADVMRSCLVLVEDLLEVLPVLLYQGLFDAQDGVAGTNAWIRRLHWGYLDEFEDAEGELWYANDAKVTVAAGWRRNVSTLTQVVVRNAGHMVPRDQPEAALAMMQQWVAGVLAEDLELHRQGTQDLQQQQQQKALWQQSRPAQLQRGVALARH